MTSKIHHSCVVRPINIYFQKQIERTIEHNDIWLSILSIVSLFSEASFDFFFFIFDQLNAEHEALTLFQKLKLVSCVDIKESSK